MGGQSGSICTLCVGCVWLCVGCAWPVRRCGWLVIGCVWFVSWMCVVSWCALHGSQLVGCVCGKWVGYVWSTGKLRVWSVCGLRVLSDGRLRVWSAFCLACVASW